MENGQAPEEEQMLRELRERVGRLEAENRRLRADEKLLRGELRRLQGMLDAIPNPVFFKDTGGRYTGCNAAFAARARLKPDQVIGKTAGDLTSPELADKTRRIDAALLRDGGTTAYEAKHVYENGTVDEMMITKAAITDSKGKVAGLVGVMTDVTERNRAERALRESQRTEHRFRRMLTALHEITNELTKIEPFDDFCRQAVVLGRERFGFDRMGLWFRRGDSNMLRGSFGTDERGRLRDERERFVSVDLRDPYGQILQHKLPVFVADDIDLVDFEGEKVGHGTQVTAPLWDGDSVIGCLSADNILRGQPFGPEDCELMKLYAATLGHLCSRKRADEALRRSEEKYRALTENTNDVVYSADAQGTVTYVGPQVVRYGRTPQEVLSHNILEFVVPEDRDRIALEFRESISTGREFPSRFRIVGEGQRVHWVEDWGKVQRDQSGKIVGITGILRDITDRKLAEQALAESEARYRSLFEDSPISLWEEDFSQVKAHLVALRSAGVENLRAYLRQHPEAVAHCAKLIRTMDVNKATLDLYKAGTKEELMAGLPTIFGRDARRMLEEELVCFDQGKRACTAEGVTYSLQGDRIDVAIKWYLVPSASEDQVRVLVSVIDVTERKRAAEAIQQAHRKLMAAREAEQRRLARDLHDSLGQQLIGLQLGLEAAGANLEGRIDGKAADSLRRLADDFRSVIREVRTISHGLYPPTLESLGLSTSLRQLAQNPPAGVRIEVNCPATLAEARFSPETEIAMFRIAQEAVNNAIRHSRADSILIDLKQRKGQVLLTVADNGDGFDVGLEEGGGLGLTAMKERADAVGGEVRIESRPGRTRVRARAPAQPAPAD